jgi:hypothetical protein
MKTVRKLGRPGYGLVPGIPRLGAPFSHTTPDGAIDFGRMEAHLTQSSLIGGT